MKNTKLVVLVWVALVVGIPAVVAALTFSDYKKIPPHLVSRLGVKVPHGIDDGRTIYMEPKGNVTTIPRIIGSSYLFWGPVVTATYVVFVLLVVVVKRL